MSWSSPPLRGLGELPPVLRFQDNPERRVSQGAHAALRRVGHMATVHELTALLALDDSSGIDA